MVQTENTQPEQASTCICFNQPHQSLVLDQELGMDQNFASISLWICTICSQRWLEYLYELEAITASGRWYLGAISPEQATHLATTEQASAVLERLDWYFYGGSYFGGQTGKASGRLSVPWTPQS